ncbi:DUF3256 family protein [uncultured Prevotella sp.]|uniref:DUF3256 family protein n=1 Tax=uncultured Prevotella sp. TaxID=159272 RepID=UPI0025F51201|nr:DUF3256 family protein [uncultured Prevotella sp.]
MSPAQNVRELFKTMPDSLAPYLTVNNRLDMMDFVDAGMKAIVTNQLGGDMEMTFLSDDSLSVKMNSAFLLDLKIQKQDTTTVVCLKRTYLTQKGQYEVVSQTFTSYWRPLSKPVVESTLSKRDDELMTLPHF